MLLKRAVCIVRTRTPKPVLAKSARPLCSNFNKLHFNFNFPFHAVTFKQVGLFSLLEKCTRITSADDTGGIVEKLVNVN